MPAWFKPKRYGYGATPTTWQGWALTVGFAAAVFALILATIGFEREGRTAGEYTILFVGVAILIAALWIISKRTTDGEWRWRWGEDSK